LEKSGFGPGVPWVPGEPGVFRASGERWASPVDDEPDFTFEKLGFPVGASFLKNDMAISSCGGR
jgi:hypothetical protein